LCWLSTYKLWIQQNMKQVFSFCIYGTGDKYCYGLQKNIHLIHTQWPTFEIYVYIGTPTIPQWLVDFLKGEPYVKCIETKAHGAHNMMFRFLPIDDPDVDLMIVRDADSRVDARDVAGIQEFLNSDKLCHIVRDHAYHNHPIMGGIWALKRGAIPFTMKSQYDTWTAKHRNELQNYNNDQTFLEKCIYPYVKEKALIHDYLPRKFETNRSKLCVRQITSPPRTGQFFIGQIYEIHPTLHHDIPVYK